VSKKALMSLGTLLLLVTLVVSLVAIVKPTPINRASSENTKQTGAIKVALVNEDIGKVYNGQAVNIGNTLVNSFIGNNSYHVELVSRAIAEKGLKTDTYQLMIILPSQFSEEALALESTAPSQANFQYQILSEQQLVVKQAEQAVVDFKEHFNKDLINIYFTSIIGNLQTAQGQVAQMVSNEEKSLTAFNHNLITPLSLYSQQFTGLSASPTNLLSAYSSFSRTLSDTTDAFTSIIDVDKTYEGAIHDIKAQQEAWQLSLDARERHLLAYDASFARLSVEEELTQLTALNSYLTKQLKEPAVWQETRDKVMAYNDDITALLERLKALNTEIDNSLSDYDTKINDAVVASLADRKAMEDGANQTLGAYIDSLNSSMATQISNKWPSYYYDDTRIDELSLSFADKQHLKNVNAFLNWYSQKTGKQPPDDKRPSFEKETLDNLKQDIKRAIESNHSVTLPIFEGEVESVTMTIPSGYFLEVEGYLAASTDGRSYQLKLPANAVPGTVISYSLKLQDKQVLSVFSPVSVKLELETREAVTAIKKDAPYAETAEVSSSAVSSLTTTPSTDDAEEETDTVTKTLTITKTNQTDTKVVKRHYDQAVTIDNWAYRPEMVSSAIYKDVKDYLQISGLVSAYYGLDLSRGAYSSASIIPAKGSIAALANSDDLSLIVTGLIKAATVEALKSDLKFSTDDLTTIQSRLANVEALKDTIDALRTRTGDLITQAAQLVEQTSTVNATLKGKPAFTEADKVDNTDMVTISMALNSDLAQLMTASQALMSNTKANQAVSERIETSIKELSSDMARLE